MAETNPTLDRLDDQIGWYDSKSIQCKNAFIRIKVATMIFAGAIPILALCSSPPWVTAVAGAIIVLLESVQQLQQYQQNWNSYRSTCEALKHEKFLFLAGADVYSESEKRLQILAERVEGLISREHAKWVSSQTQSQQVKPQEN
jgi:hypothetical protein